MNEIKRTEQINSMLLNGMISSVIGCVLCIIGGFIVFLFFNSLLWDANSLVGLLLYFIMEILTIITIIFGVLYNIVRFIIISSYKIKNNIDITLN